MEVEPIRKLEDVKRMYNWLNENYTPREAECFLIGCNIALRAGDLLRIKFEDVEGKKFIDLNEQKTGKFKRIPITDVVRGAVARLREYYESRKFYVTRDFVPVYFVPEHKPPRLSSLPACLHSVAFKGAERRR